jgi:hypothetical protein
MASGLFKNGKATVADTGTTIYTVPAGKYAVIHAIYLCNTYGLEDLYANIEVVASGGGSSFNIAYMQPVGANQYLVVDRPINLQDGESIKVTGSRDASIDAFASVLEFTP